MAQVQNTKVGRTIRYIKKKARVTIQGLAPSKIMGRLNGPIVMSNSIPKSGTHLIENIFEQLPGLRNAGHRTISSKAGKPLDSVIRDIESMCRGAFYNAHLPGYKEVIEAVNACGVKVVFLVRDPRDIVVSRYKYVTYIDKLHPAHKYFVDQKSDSARLSLSIKGVEGVMPSIGKVLESFAPWLVENGVLVCRFEDLVGESGGGSSSRQDEAILRIIRYLGYDIADVELSRLKKNALSIKTSTYRKGQIGGWSEEFEKQHIELLDQEVKGRIQLFGYN